jgi:spore germination protein KB
MIQGNGKITSQQFGVLVFLYTVGTTILVIPSGLASVAKQDAWIGALAGICYGLLILWLYATLWRLYPNKTFVGICETVLGKFVGKTFSLIFVFYSFIGAVTVLFYLGNFFKIQFLPRTPVLFINAIFAIVVVMGVRMGLEAISRTAELLMPWFIILYCILIFTLAPEIKTENLQPVLETGVKPILWAGFSFAGTAYLPMVFLFMIFPSVLNPEQARKNFFMAALIGGLCVVLVTLLCISILGVNITSRSLFPSLSLVKKINIGSFLQRIEAIMAGLWFITTYFKTTFYFFSGVSSLAEIMKLKNYRSITLPLGMFMVAYSLIVYPDIVYMQKWDSTVFLPYILTIGLFIPLLLLVAGLLKKAVNRNRKTS